MVCGDRGAGWCAGLGLLWYAGDPAGWWCVMALGVRPRVRLAQRADKVWRSVYHRQLLVVQDPKPLTIEGWCGTKDGVRPSRLDVSDGPTDQQEEV